MPRSLPLALAAALAACSRAPAPAPAPASAPPADAGRPKADPAELARRQQIAEQTLAGMRRALFDRQLAVAVPPKVAGLERLRALIPKGLTVRIVGTEVKRDMDLSRPHPGRTVLGLVWITPDSVDDTTRALRASLESGGWLRAGEPLTPTLRNAAGDRLDWEVGGHPGEPARVRLTLTLDRPTEPVPPGRALVEVVPAWLDVAPSPTGFEFDRLHGVRPGVATTDVERLALAFHEPDAAAADALLKRLQDRVRALGYQADAANPHLFRGPDGTTFTTRATGPGDLVAHHQRHWTRKK